MITAYPATLIQMYSFYAKEQIEIEGWEQVLLRARSALSRACSFCNVRPTVYLFYCVCYQVQKWLGLDLELWEPFFGAAKGIPGDIDPNIASSSR